MDQPGLLSKTSPKTSFMMFCASQGVRVGISLVKFTVQEIMMSNGNFQINFSLDFSHSKFNPSELRKNISSFSCGEEK